MGKIALLPDDIRSKGIYLGNRKLPDNYMADFTLMGFVVDRYLEARNILKAAGFMLDEQDGGTDIYIDNALRLEEIETLLAANKIRCDFSDIADTFYQA